MQRTMKTIAVISVAATVIFTLFYVRNGSFLPFAITAGTIAYHFLMRLFIGSVYSVLMKNRADYHKAWYRIRPWEERLYRTLKVKKWKNKMPTYDPDIFNPRIHSWDEIAQAMCQSELVHETIVVFSFLPIVACRWFGSAPVFVITSLLAAAIDLSFVMMQRYNRARIEKIWHLKSCKRY